MKNSWFRYALARAGHRQSMRWVSTAESLKRSVLHRACVALRNGRIEAARALIEEFDQPERDAACLNVLGLIAIAEGQVGTARTLWNQSLRLNPSYIPAMVNLRCLLFPAFAADRPLYGDEPTANPTPRKVHS